MEGAAMTYESQEVDRVLVGVRVRAALVMLRQAVATLPIEEQLRLSGMTVVELAKEFQRPPSPEEIERAYLHPEQPKGKVINLGARSRDSFSKVKPGGDR